VTHPTPTLWLMNSFSLNTLREFACASVRMRVLSLAEARAYARQATSAVGHPDTAELFGRHLGMLVVMNRQTVVMQRGDCALVGQHVGERLPMGAMTRPSDAEIRWLLVEVMEGVPLDARPPSAESAC